MSLNNLKQFINDAELASFIVRYAPHSKAFTKVDKLKLLEELLNESKIPTDELSSFISEKIYQGRKKIIANWIEPEKLSHLLDKFDELLSQNFTLSTEVKNILEICGSTEHAKEFNHLVMVDKFYTNGVLSSIQLLFAQKVDIISKVEFNNTILSTPIFYPVHIDIIISEGLVLARGTSKANIRYLDRHIRDEHIIQSFLDATAKGLQLDLGATPQMAKTFEDGFKSLYSHISKTPEIAIKQVDTISDSIDSFVKSAYSNLKLTTKDEEILQTTEELKKILCKSIIKQFTQEQKNAVRKRTFAYITHVAADCGKSKTSKINHKCEHYESLASDPSFQDVDNAIGSDKNITKIYVSWFSVEKDGYVISTIIDYFNNRSTSNLLINFTSYTNIGDINYVLSKIGEYVKSK